MKQEFTSAGTSINAEKLPTIYTKLGKLYEKLNLNPEFVFDFGCGKYTEHLKKSAEKECNGSMWFGYDPFNQPVYENANTMSVASSARRDCNKVFISSNVLNVIKEAECRRAYLLQFADNMENPEDVLFITVYEGNGTGIGKVSKKDCWQENRKLKDYIEEVESVGFSVERKYGVLICKRA